MPGLDDPIEGIYTITPSDTVDLTIPTRAIFLSVAGNLKMTTVNGTTVTMVGLSAGVLHRIRVRRVWATGTGASGIMGCY